jgi:hypothetical protein
MMGMGSILTYIGSVLSNYFRIWFWLLIGLLLIALVIYLAVIIPHNKLAASHIENIKMIELGMTPNQVRTTMGNRGLYKNTWGQDSVYSYEAGLFSSSNIEIIFNDSMRVRNVIVPEGVVSPITVNSSEK